MQIQTSNAAAKSLQSCLTLCDPIDGSPPGSPIPGILQARTLEWVAISFSSAWKWKVKVKLLTHVWLLETPWTVAYQTPPSMGFSRQEYWSGVPLPSPTDATRMPIIKKVGNSKPGEGGAIWTLIHHQWGCMTGQPLWKTVWQLHSYTSPKRNENIRPYKTSTQIFCTSKK